MTIAFGLKVGDCVVIGADSASTMSDGDGGVVNVYFSAEKVMNLRKDLPIGLVTYGLGGLGGRSITTHAKDLRKFTGVSGHHLHLDPNGYTMEEVAERVRQHFLGDLYAEEWPRTTVNDDGNTVNHSLPWALSLQATGVVNQKGKSGALESMRMANRALHALSERVTVDLR